VVDVFDALSSRRCYRDAISSKDTLTYMADEMIDQFDSLVFEFILYDKEAS